jgi:hypothetical protein
MSLFSFLDKLSTILLKFRSFITYDEFVFAFNTIMLDFKQTTDFSTEYVLKKAQNNRNSL